MSAFAVRVNSDKQTLILAGEAIPPRRADARPSEMGLRVQRVTMLLVQGEYAASAFSADTSPARFLAAADSDRVLAPSATAVAASAAPAQFLVPYASPNRTPSPGAAEYARTQNLSGGRTKSQFIDTYA
jgi:hypothetical protein